MRHCIRLLFEPWCRRFILYLLPNVSRDQCGLSCWISLRIGTSWLAYIPRHWSRRCPCVLCLSDTNQKSDEHVRQCHNNRSVAKEDNNNYYSWKWLSCWCVLCYLGVSIKHYLTRTRHRERKVSEFVDRTTHPYFTCLFLHQRYSGELGKLYPVFRRGRH